MIYENYYSTFGSVWSYFGVAFTVRHQIEETDLGDPWI